MKYSELYRKLKPYFVADMRAIGTAGGVNTGGGGGGGLTSHELADTTGLGTYHTVSGLTAGQVLIATGATSAAFGTIDHDDLATVTPDQHHAQTHGILSGDHTGTGSALDLIGFSATNTLGKLTPSSNPGAAAAILASTALGGLTLVTMDAGTFTATTKVRTPTIDTASGSLTLAPSNATVALPTDGVLSTASGGLTIAPAGDLTLNPGASNVLPGGSIEDDLGDYNRKWRTLYAAELYVETLVAQDVLATIGGRIMVAPTTSLIADLASGGATMDVKHNIFASGDFAYMAAAPGGVAQVEALKITSAATVITGGYRYSITRNQDGSGANGWVSGDALAHLGGAAGEGYFDITATQTALNHLGPTIIGYVRTAATNWNDLDPVTAQGNLSSFIDYAGDEFGFAAGNDLTLTPTTGFKGVAIDRTNGARFFNTDITLYSGATLKAKIQNDGKFYFGALTGAHLEWDNTDFKGVDAGGVAQWYGRSTDGRFYAGAGKAWLDVNGLSLLTSPSSFNTSYAVNWYAAVGGTRQAGIGAWTFSGATQLSIENNSHKFTLDQSGRVNLQHSGGNISLSSLANSYTNVVNDLGVGLAYDATPSARLHIYGTSPVIRLASVGSTENITLGFYDSDSTLRGALLYAGVNSSPNKYFGLSNPAAEQLRMLSDLHTWYNYGTTERMRLDATGLGIGGTPGTNERLSVQGGTNRVAVQISSSNAYGPYIALTNNLATYGRTWELRSSGTSDTTAGAFEVINRSAPAVRMTVSELGAIRSNSHDDAKSARFTPLSSVNLANGAEATFTAYPGGLVCVIDVTGSTVGLFLVRGTGAATPVLVSENPASNYSNADTSGRVCLYWNGTTYAVKNRTGATHDFSIIHLGASNYA